jgi:hypothetical protein
MVIVLHTIYAEIDDNVTGGYSTFNRISDILISSPSAQVYYHSDHNGQTLWQVHGSKRVYVYPNEPPFLTKKMLEYTALYSDETSVTYDPSYDQSASIYELKAGNRFRLLPTVLSRCRLRRCASTCNFLGAESRSAWPEMPKQIAVFPPWLDRLRTEPAACSSWCGCSLTPAEVDRESG